MYERFKLDPEGAKENKLAFEEITAHLAQLEREAGNWQQAINWFQAAQKLRRTRTRCNSGLTKLNENGGTTLPHKQQPH